jgi:hypothetical protein
LFQEWLFSVDCYGHGHLSVKFYQLILIELGQDTETNTITNA